MNEISDDLLMAYVDRELDQNTRDQVDAYFARNPAEVRRLLAFAITSRNLAKLFEQPMREPSPGRLINAIKSAPRATSTPLRSKRNTHLRQMAHYHRLPLAAAASVAAFAVLGGIAWRVSREFQISYQSLLVATDTPVAKVLDSLGSGKTEEVALNGQQASIKVILSFSKITGGYCREYEIYGPNAGHSLNVACREPNGPWKIEVKAPAPLQNTPKTTVVPAGGNVSAQVEAVIDHLISGDPLSPEEEAQVIRLGWADRRKAKH